VSLAVVLAGAALFFQPQIVTIALLAALTFMIPHSIWHISHSGRFATGDVVAQVVVNAIPIGVALACLRWSWTRSPGIAPVATES